MKNRILLLIVSFFVIALLGSEKLSAQINSQANRKNWIDVDSYNGSTTFAFQYSIALSGLHLNYADWNLVVNVNSPIINSEGKTIDASKIKIRIKDITGFGAPTIQDLGIQNTPKPLSFGDVYIVEKSNFNLRTGGNEDNNRRYVFDFDIIVEGGEYLEQLKSWNQYSLSLTFSVLAANKKTVLTQDSDNPSFRIYPKDTPPSGPEFGFEVYADASLNFNVPEDYTRKVESSEESWLKVTSKDKGYEVWVNSGDANFNGDSSAPPVNVVSVKVGDSTPITLSNTVAPGQLVYAGNATNKTTKELNVRYFITSEKSKELVKYGGNNYTTTLTYTLIPN